MIKTRNVFRVNFVKNIEPIHVCSISFGGAAALAAEITDEEIISIVKLSIEVNVKVD